ncbi:MAG: 4Fe-4S dicluster domain-containing protein [Syntrophales bacterium]|nr:4Fe-4S dicluster domain-containing protein [Syntrophales bacterium]
MKRVYPREEVCIGCHLCEIACIVEHSASKDIIKAFKAETPRPTARNLVEEEGAISFSVSCRHCNEPPCVQACISGAMVKDYQSGVVRHLEEKCMGCWSCIMACPYGVIRKNPVRKTVIKCDLCPERPIPACVEACPNRALIFEER